MTLLYSRIGSCVLAATGMLCLIAPAAATVTFDGTEGVNTQVIAPSCATAFCHDGTISPDLTTYSGASAAIVRILARMQDSVSPMPPAGLLDGNLVALVQAWSDALTPQNAAPAAVTDPASAVAKNSATFNATVNDNGIEAVYTFEFGAGDFSSSVSAPDNDGNSGGGISEEAVSANVAGLVCATAYQYRVSGSNPAGITTGLTETFTTTACNTVPTIDTIASQSATEDQPFALTVDVTDADGPILTDSLSFSISSVAAFSGGVPQGPPPEIQIDSATGVINWTPTDEFQDRVDVTVLLTDADADPGFDTAMSTFTINVTLIDEPPAFADVPAAIVMTPEDIEYSFDFSAASDPENTVLGFSVSSVPDITGPSPNLNIDSNGRLSWTPDGTISPVDVSVTISDGNNSNDQSNTFQLSVIASNDAPAFAGVVDQTIDEEQTLSYTVVATDIDGDDLEYSLTVAPEGMTIVPATGVVTWTPAEVPPGAPAVFDVTVAVTDNIIAVPVAAMFTVTVNPRNDQPVLTAIEGPFTLTEFDNLSINAGDNLTDPDDNNDGSGAIVWSLVGAPEGMTVSSTGLVEWTPGENTAGEYVVTVQAQDGGEDGSLPQMQPLSIVVNLLDTDEDLVADYNDNCPETANGNQDNFDEDELGDVCDSDDDNDGVGDAAEAANGLDPFDPSDGALDSDGDGLTNAEEFALCEMAGDVNCAAISVDSVAPVIEADDLTVIATGYVTDVQFGATATDTNDGVVVVSVDQVGPFRPGRYLVTLTSTDSANNTATLQKTLDVLPLVTLAGTTLTGEGRAISIPVTLNGLAPTYPVTLEFSVGGMADAADHNLADGSVVIESGTAGSIVVAVSDDGLIEGTESFTITLTGSSDNVALADAVTHTVSIVEENIAPVVSFTVLQQGVSGQIVYQDRGEATITANGIDPNGDVLTFDWSGTARALGGMAVGAQYTFDPSTVASGSYPVEVLVDDGLAQTLASTVIVIDAVAPELQAGADSDDDGLDDLSEGLGDADADGIPDYLDPVDAQTLLNARVSDRFSRLLRTIPGTSLALGDFAIAAQTNGAAINSVAVTDAGGQAVEDDEFTIIGAIYDFQVRGLTATQRSASVVLPQPISVPVDASYRKFSGGVWSTFVENGTDMIRTASSIAGECPAPGDAAYQGGLRAFTDCIELTLTDGGPNDADGTADGIIRDPGGVAVRSTVVGSVNNPPPPAPPPSSGPRGGGALSWLLFAALFLFLAGRYGRNRGRS